MNSLETLREYLRFDTWANGLILRSLRNSAKPSIDAVRRFGHIVLAERFWLMRILGNAPVAKTADFWATESVSECEKLCELTRQNYESFFKDLTEEKLSNAVNYSNSRGETFTNTLRDIFTHVFFHSAQHRGQVIEAIRRNGEEPPYVDFIGYLRQKA
jgi:uncharacterized damage-inducible protein DinB